MAGWEEFWRESSAEASLIGTSGTHPLFVQYWTTLFSKLGLTAGKSHCIDIASGSGIVIRCARDHFGEAMPLFSGLDSSATAIDQLTTRYPEIQGIVSDAASIPLDSHSFELATSQFGVEYAGIQGILETARLVAVGGNLALVLHCRPGAIYAECSTSLQAVDRVRQARFFPLARTMFESGFAAFRSGERRPYERAVRKFKPAFRTLEQVMTKHGEDVASGFVLRLHSDIEQMNQRLQNYDPKELLDWLAQLDAELLAYRGRMKSMTDAAISAKALEQIESKLSDAGFSIAESRPFYDQAEETQLAWVLQARRDSIRS